MEQKDIRKIKRVDGYRVNHPHSAANIFYALFTLIIAALPVAYLFLPLIDKLGGQEITGLHLYQFGFGFVMGIISHTGVAPTGGIQLVMDASGDMFRDPVGFIFVGLSAVLYIMAIFSLVLIILFFVLLIKGYLTHSKAVKVFTVFQFIFALLFGLAMLVIYLLVKIGSSGATDLFVWASFYPAAGALLLLIIISIIHTCNFANSVREKDLVYHEEEPVVEHVTKVNEITRIKYEPSNTIPPNTTSIGGHAFAENQNLTVANIPLGVGKLGNSAFANCLNLKVVSLPADLKEIGFNCFFNCVELERINYAGTKEEWRKITRGSNWLAKAKTTEVICLDGAIVVNPYH